MKQTRSKQTALPTAIVGASRSGGRRRGPGRPPKGGRAGVSHGKRANLKARFPVHVTVKLHRGLPRLRLWSTYRALRAAFAAGSGGTAAAPGGVRFRLCHYAVLNDHLHFIVEAEDRTSLARGIQGLLVRIARRLDKLWRRRG